MRRVKNESGAALVVTLLVVVMLTVVVTDFLFGTYVDYSIAASFRDDVTASTAARTGVEAAREVILEDIKDGNATDHLGEAWANFPGFFYGKSATNFVAVSIKDESGKLNLNYLSDARPNPDAPPKKLFAVFQRLLEGLQLNEEIADAVVDWLDEDHLGASEDGYYSSLTAPYRCKNGKFDSLEELKRVRFVTPEAFAMLSPYITVSSGSEKININTASKRLITALDYEIESYVDEILEARDLAPFPVAIKVKEILAGIPPDSWININGLIKVSSNVFSVESTITAGEVTRTVEAIYSRSSASDAKLLYYRII